jgi:hypothetical protein
VALEVNERMMKKHVVMMAAAAVALTTFAGATLAGAGTSKGNWVCLVDGAPVKVKGKDAKEQKKACEAKGGSWEKQKASGAQTAPQPEPPSGGGW